jgi:hypothetical protein
MDRPIKGDCWRILDLSKRHNHFLHPAISSEICIELTPSGAQGEASAALGLAGQTYRNLQRPHLALSHPTPPYRHLLTTAGERQLSGGES